MDSLYLSLEILSKEACDKDSFSPVEAGAAGAYSPVFGLSGKAFSQEKRRSFSLIFRICNAYGKEGK